MKHLLLVVSGMTPQIITETLYGIYKKSPHKLPHAIKVITTSDGKDRLCNTLMGENGHIQRFCLDYNLPIIPFNEEDVLVPNDDHGIPLLDVRTEREQAIVSDFITATVRSYANQPDTAIHASLAGGRKTMGFSLGYAMSLFGRPQDCLSHVLVSSPYEEIPDFYYPTPATVMRTDRSKHRHHDLSLAEVTLAEIPLVLMREEMPADLIIREDLSYTDTVERINQALKLTEQSASIHLNYETLTIDCDGRAVPMKPDCFAFYSWIAQDSQKAPGEGIEPPLDGMHHNEIDRRLAEWALSLLPTYMRKRNLNAEAAVETADDFLHRAGNTQVTGTLLKSSKETAQLLSFETDMQDRQKKLKGLWDRLLRETNDRLKEVLGIKLASLYQIETVSKIEQAGVRRKIECKGIRLLPENINI